MKKITVNLIDVDIERLKAIAVAKTDASPDGHTWEIEDVATLALFYGIGLLEKDYVN